MRVRFAKTIIGHLPRYVLLIVYNYLSDWYVTASSLIVLYFTNINLEKRRASLIFQNIQVLVSEYGLINNNCFWNDKLCFWRRIDLKYLWEYVCTRIPWYILGIFDLVYRQTKQQTYPTLMAISFSETKWNNINLYLVPSEDPSFIYISYR